MVGLSSHMFSSAFWPRISCILDLPINWWWPQSRRGHVWTLGEPSHCVIPYLCGPKLLNETGWMGWDTCLDISQIGTGIVYVGIGGIHAHLLFSEISSCEAIINVSLIFDFSDGKALDCQYERVPFFLAISWFLLLVSSFDRNALSTEVWMLLKRLSRIYIM